MYFVGDDRKRDTEKCYFIYWLAIITTMYIVLQMKNVEWAVSLSFMWFLINLFLFWQQFGQKQIFFSFYFEIFVLWTLKILIILILALFLFQNTNIHFMLICYQSKFIFIYFQFLLVFFTVLTQISQSYYIKYYIFTF
jgi:hypothetical protein